MLKAYIFAVIILLVPILLIAVAQIGAFCVNKKNGAEGETSYAMNCLGTELFPIGAWPACLLCFFTLALNAKKVNTANIYYWLRVDIMRRF